MPSMKSGEKFKSGSDRKGESLAIDYRLHIHPTLWDGIRKYLAMKLDDVLRDSAIYPKVEFLELKIVCDPGVEGWHILPAPALPAIV